MEKASKNFIANLKKQKRENKSLLFLDNVKIIKDAISSQSIQPLYILTSLDEEHFENQNFDKLKDIQIFRVEEKTIEQLCDTVTPQKILCVAVQKENTFETPSSNFLVLDGLQDPGNVGTLIRTAKACGFEYVFLVECVRKNNEKLIRSSVGTIFLCKTVEMKRNEFVSFAKEKKLHLICCDMSGENIFSFQPKGQVGVVVGNEGQGVSKEISEICEQTVKIPMCDGIESLNAGVSGSIIMYEINKNLFK